MIPETLYRYLTVGQHIIKDKWLIKINGKVCEYLPFYTKSDIINM